MYGCFSMSDCELYALMYVECELNHGLDWVCLDNCMGNLIHDWDNDVVLVMWYCVCIALDDDDDGDYGYVNCQGNMLQHALVLMIMLYFVWVALHDLELECIIFMLSCFCTATVCICVMRNWFWPAMACCLCHGLFWLELDYIDDELYCNLTWCWCLFMSLDLVVCRSTAKEF